MVTIMPTPRERQQAYREHLRSRGYRRLDIVLDPKVYAKLRPFLAEYDKEGSHPGFAVVRLLEDCAKSWTEPTS